MNRIKKTVIMSTISTALICTLTGCGTGKDDIEKPEVLDDEYTDYDKVLDDGVFYVRHNDGTYDPVYLGKAAFAEGDTNTEPDVTKVAWYKNDFEEIPTLYEDDMLILYTTEELDETFIFERFKDYGYSIGLRNLEVTPSGRYAVKTEEDKDEKKIIAYPEGDTAEISNLANDSVIIDTIGGVKIRDNKDNEDAFSFLTDAGTIGGLEKGATYKAEIYEGTVQHVYNFTADVRILGEIEAYKSTDYDFISTTIIKINIPQDWNSGYYMINGKGIFRYVKGSSYNDDTDFNIPNETEDEKDKAENKTDSNGKNNNLKKNDTDKDSTSVVTDEYYKDSDGNYINADDVIDNKVNSKKTYESAKTYGTQELNVNENGKIYVNITFNGEYPEGVSAIIGEKGSASGYKFEKVGNTLQAKFSASPGLYTIYYYSDEKLDIKSVEVTNAYDREGK